MRKSLISTAVLGALFAPPLVLADDAPSGPSLSYNIGVYSQYIFRGLTQTDGKPAVQGGVDLTLPNGFYAGLWASNISWLRDVYNASSNPVGQQSYYTTGGHMELDIYGGYRYSFANGVGIDVGALRYQYPGDRRDNTWAKANTTEVYGALNYGWIQGKISTVVSPQAWGWGSYKSSDHTDSAVGTYYAELNATIPVGDLIKGTPALAGVTGIAHIGRQDFAGGANEYASYTDYKLGLQKSFSGEGFINGVNIGGYWSYANGKDSAWKYNGDNLGDSTGTFYVQKTF